MLDLVRSTLESPVNRGSAPGTSCCLLGLMCCDVIFLFFSYLIASLRDVEASFVHVSLSRQPFCEETSIKLCGLLRKTGAKIPAGPFRYSEARQ